MKLKKELNNDKIKILIAHQTIIPPYRINFYTKLYELMPKNWEVHLVTDRKFNGDIPKSNIIRLKTYRLFQSPCIVFQNMLPKILNYDIIIIEDALNNILYSLCYIAKINGTKIIRWGHGYDHNFNKNRKIKDILEKIKLLLTKNSDGYLAYTKSVKRYLVEKGLSEKKIYVINNTIDIIRNRQEYLYNRKKKEELMKKYGLENKIPLIFVGRNTRRKNLKYLLKAFNELYHKNNKYRLILVGIECAEYKKLITKNENRNGIILYQSNYDLKFIAELYTISELYLFPGDVGLGPLQAMCYDLVPVILSNRNHGPEIDYLNRENSIILDRASNYTVYADIIDFWISNKERLMKKKESIWSSISLLTIENMVRFFINAINQSCIN